MTVWKQPLSADGADARGVLPEIPEHEIDIRAAGRRAVQLGVDDAAASLDRGMVAEVVGGFQHEPCRIDRGLVRCSAADLAGCGVVEVLLANCGAELRQHCKYSPANSRMMLGVPVRCTAQCTCSSG